MNEGQIVQFKEDLKAQDWRPSKSKNHPSQPLVGLARACGKILAQTPAVWFYDFFNPLLDHMKGLYQQGAIFKESNFRRMRGNVNYIRELLGHEINLLEQIAHNSLMKIKERDMNRHQDAQRARYFQEALRDSSLEQFAEKKVDDNTDVFLSHKTRLLLAGLRREGSYAFFTVETVQEIMRDQLAVSPTDRLNFVVDSGEQVCLGDGELRRVLELQQRLGRDFTRRLYGRDEDIWKQLEARLLDAKVYSSLIRHAPVAYVSITGAYDLLKSTFDFWSDEGRNVFVNIAPRAAK